MRKRWLVVNLTAISLERERLEWSDQDTNFIYNVKFTVAFYFIFQIGQLLTENFFIMSSQFLPLPFSPIVFLHYFVFYAISIFRLYPFSARSVFLTFFETSENVFVILFLNVFPPLIIVLRDFNFVSRYFFSSLLGTERSAF